MTHALTPTRITAGQELTHLLTRLPHLTTHARPPLLRRGACVGAVRWRATLSLNLATATARAPARRRLVTTIRTTRQETAMPRRNTPPRRTRRVLLPPPEAPGRREDGEALARALVRAGRASVDILERRDAFGPPGGTAGEQGPIYRPTSAEPTRAPDHPTDRSTHA